MNQYLSKRSEAVDLLRLKKALYFIRLVVSDYGTGIYDHLGFSHALATSKAEELREQVDPFCPVEGAFGGLVEAMKKLVEDSSAFIEAERCLDEISGYFELERFAMLRR
jgi:hypothetical protein